MSTSNHFSDGGRRSMDREDMALHHLAGSDLSGLQSMADARRSPFDALVAAEEGDPPDAMTTRVDTYRRMMAFLFRSGPDPVSVAKNCWALAGHYHPALLRGACTLQEIGQVFGETRAAASARGRKINRIVDEALAREGREEGYHSPNQKSRATVERNRRAAKGNKNRSGSCKGGAR